MKPMNDAGKLQGMSGLEIRAALILLNKTFADVARELGVHRSLPRRVAFRQYRTRRAERYMAELIGKPYIAVWGIEESEDRR